MDEEEILSPREIAIIERWMEKHRITIEEPIFYPEDPWQFAMIETIETIRESKQHRVLEDLPEDIQDRLRLITFKMLFNNCSKPLLKDGDLTDLTPARRRMVERRLKEIITKELRQLTQGDLGEAMEERDGLKKTLMEERRQWKEEKSRLAKKLNAQRSEKKERRR